MTRDLSAVLARIRPLLVQGGIDVAGFDSLASSAAFSAPENMIIHWRDVCEWLADNIPPPVMGAPAWVLEISDIVEGRK